MHKPKDCANTWDLANATDQSGILLVPSPAFKRKAVKRDDLQLTVYLETMSIQLTTMDYKSYADLVCMEEIMVLIPNSEIRDVHGITSEQKQLIKAFLQGAVYSWAKNRPNEQFAARDLVGGENFEWSGTPLIVLYDKHINTGKSNEDAIKAAGIDLGWLLKAVLSEDKRHYESGDSGLTAGYRWIGNEP